MATVRKVLIIGGGIAGLVSAACLKQRGADPEIIEKADSWTIKGAGMHLYSNALRALDAVGVAREIVETGVAQDDYIYADPLDEHRVQVTYPRLAGKELPALASISRVAMHDILVSRVTELDIPVRLGTTFSGLEQDRDGVDVTFSDGSQSRYDLVIGCDGIYSQVRNEIFGKLDPTYTGQAIWRAMLRRHPDSVLPKIMYAGGGKMFGIVPTSADQVYLLAGMPDPDKPTYAPESFVGLIKDNFAEFGGLASFYLDQITEPAQVGYTAIEMVTQDAPWHRGRVFLIGDAAHASPPYLAQGAAMAIEDAVVLGELVAQDLALADLQEQFMARRFERASMIQRLSLQRNKERYQGGSYTSGSSGKSDRFRELEETAQLKIDELYSELARPI